MKVVTTEDMSKAFKPCVFTKVAENSPLSDLLKPCNKACMIASHPGVAELIPNKIATIYKDVIHENATKARDELMECMSRRPGDVNVGSDRVTINSKPKQACTVSRGKSSVF